MLLAILASTIFLLTNVTLQALPDAISWPALGVCLVLLILFVALLLARLDSFTCTLLATNAEWIFLIGQLLLYVGLTLYQRSFEAESYGAGVLHVDQSLFWDAICVQQAFWLSSAFFVISGDALMIAHVLSTLHLLFWSPCSLQFNRVDDCAPELFALCLFLAQNFMAIALESFQHEAAFVSQRFCVLSCSTTAQMRITMLLQLSAFALKYLVGLVRGRGMMTVLRSAVRYELIAKA